MRLLTVVLAIGGVLEALLMSRLTLRLLAARPDNPIFAALFALTAPLIAPFTALDSGQPRFGAVLELSTLALCGILALLMLALAWRGRMVTTKHALR